MSADFAAAREFVYANGRVLEQRLFARLFEHGPADGVVDALRGFRNADGGFGHGLEPDKRCPASQPLDVQLALETMEAAGAVDAELARCACGWLATVCDDGGRVPLVLPSIREYPHAVHMRGDHPPDLNATLGILAVLVRAGIEHPWRRRAESTAWAELDADPPAEAHALRSAFPFLEAASADPRAEALRARLRELLPAAAWFKADADSDDYGVTPLEYPPHLFAADELAPHLDRLERDQAADGGWVLAWQPPTAASELEWRALRTIEAVRILRRHGRLGLR